MSRTRWSQAVMLFVAVLLMASATGCKGSEKAETTTPQPVANKERVVPEPPAPPVWPYTGKDAPNSAAVQKRPLSVKIENLRPARPQTGLAAADVVYETKVEGGITRFNCIFHSDVPKSVGPVRSARLSDLWIVPQYDAIFAFSGAHRSVRDKIAAAKLPDLSQGKAASPYSRNSSRSAPHNLYMNTTKAYAAAKKKGFALTADLEPLQFLAHSEESTDAVTKITIPFSDYQTTKWSYKDGSYRRSNGDTPHTDTITGKQITADNVVVMWAKYTDAKRQSHGSTTFDIDMGGEGRVSVFRNGARYDGTWIADRDTPPVFKDDKGLPIKLAPGRTWFEVIPLDGKISMK